MGILKRIGIQIGSIIQYLIILYLAVLIIGQIVLSTVLSNEMVEAAYNKGYYKGLDEGYQSGLEIGYKEGLPTDVVLRNPTYKELMDFLARDKTDLKPRIKGEYVCEDFSAEVNNNAELEGIRAAFVVMEYPQPPGHAIVAFETVDKGLIFIEPQTDERVEQLVIGKRFYQLYQLKVPQVPQYTLAFHWARPHEAFLGSLDLLRDASFSDSGYYYSPPPYDDTIVEFQIIW